MYDYGRNEGRWFLECRKIIIFCIVVENIIMIGIFSYKDMGVSCV